MSVQAMTGAAAGTTDTPSGAAAGNAGAVAPAATSWVSTLSDEHKGVVELKQWKSPGDIVQSYKHLESLHGVPADQILKLPAKPDDAEGWGKTYAKLGKPEKADGYKLPPMEGTPPETIKAIQEAYFGANLTQKQAEALTAKTIEMSKAAIAQEQMATQVAGEKAVNSLKQEWGQNYEVNLRLIDNAANQLGLKDEHMVALRKALGPVEAPKFVFELAKKLGGEDTFVSGDKGSAFGRLSPLAAKAKRADLMKDSTFINRFASGDVAAKKEINDLDSIIFGG